MNVNENRLIETIGMLERANQWLEGYARRQFWWGVAVGIAIGAAIVHVAFWFFVWRASRGF